MPRNQRALESACKIGNIKKVNNFLHNGNYENTLNWIWALRLAQGNSQIEIMEIILTIAIIFVLLAPLVWLWISGIDYMDKHHPDYKGNDLFGEFDEDDKNQIG